MHASWESDGSIIPAKSANKGAPEESVEWMEERNPADRNVAQPAPPRTQSRNEAGTGETVGEEGAGFACGGIRPEEQPGGVEKSAGHGIRERTG